MRCHGYRSRRVPIPKLCKKKILGANNDVRFATTRDPLMSKVMVYIALVWLISTISIYLELESINTKNILPRKGPRTSICNPLYGCGRYGYDCSAARGSAGASSERTGAALSANLLYVAIYVWPPYETTCQRLRLYCTLTTSI